MKISEEKNIMRRKQEKKKRKSKLRNSRQKLKTRL